MWAIKNRRTGKWVYGTDHRYWPPHQRTSDDKAMTFDDWEGEEDLGGHTFLEGEMKSRRMGKDYIPVKVKLTEVHDD